MSNSTHGGKGDRQRKTNAKKFNSNFDAIFRKKFKELKDDQESKGKFRKDLPRDGRMGED